MAEIIEKCVGCDRVKETYIAGGTVRYCMSYEFPATKWRNGVCNMASHVKKHVVAQIGSANPLKASKRRAKGK